jgi:hypothetical protein
MLRRGNISAQKTLCLEQMIFLKACTSGGAAPKKSNAGVDMPCSSVPFFKS